MLSVVIPTLDAGKHLGRTLESLEGARGEGLIGEVVVVDAGSRDGTLAIAEGRGARVVAGPRGRGAQLAAGAAEALGEWLLFLHADTALEGGWEGAAARFMADARNAEKAAVFRFAVDDERAAARRLEAAVAWRCRLLGLPYGDQGLLLARALYQRVGGFRPLPLMEDVDIVRRIGGRGIVHLAPAAVTSAARFRRAGYVRRSIRNLACVGLYFLGVPPRLIVRLYG